jgi:2,3-bisphosphoglycerate-independent phosphoglycerate mutase
VNEAWFQDIVVQNDTKLVLLVLDGLGGLPYPGRGCTELSAARTPNLDALAQRSECGLLDPVYPGVSPGSGPGHLALFGYDPLRYDIGRGVISASGIGFDLTTGDIAARCNFATVDAEGVVTDRAGDRIPTDVCRRLCKKISDAIPSIEGVQIFLLPEKSFRACLILRGNGLSGAVSNTDPLREGGKPLEPKRKAPEAEKTARVVSRFLIRAYELLRDEKPANSILVRGFDSYRAIPSFTELYRLHPLGLASYPAYQGLARLVGMEVAPCESYDQQLESLERQWAEHDYFFFHTKDTDERGEDGDFEAKVAAIENVDAMLPRILDLEPDVLAVTGDHSTPVLMKTHSWHPVPVLLHSAYCRSGLTHRFDESSCAGGALGRRPAKTLMPQMLAHGLRLKRWGA